jgi:hypothetical protein
MMGLSNAWINSYNSLMKLQQDPVTGMLTGTYSSTTGGTGTYDIVGWAALNKPTTKAGQGMAISILWRSNDGGNQTQVMKFLVWQDKTSSWNQVKI